MFGMPSCGGMAGGISACMITWMLRKNGGFAVSDEHEQMSKNMTISI